MKLLSIEGFGRDSYADTIHCEFEVEDKTYVIVTQVRKTTDLNKQVMYYGINESIQDKEKAYRDSAVQEISSFIAMKLLKNYIAIEKLST